MPSLIAIRLAFPRLALAAIFFFAMIRQAYHGLLVRCSGLSSCR